MKTSSSQEEDLKVHQRSSRMPLIPASMRSSHHLLLWPQCYRHNPYVLHQCKISLAGVPVGLILQAGR